MSLKKCCRFGRNDSEPAQLRGGRGAMRNQNNRQEKPGGRSFRTALVLPAAAILLISALLFCHNGFRPDAAEKEAALALRPLAAVHTAGARVDGMAAAEHIERGAAGASAPTVSVSSTHAAWVNADGSVSAKGDNSAGECDVGAWQDMAAVDTAYGLTAGLKADGTVVFAGTHYFETAQKWTGLVDIALTDDYIVGLKADGTVVAEWPASFSFLEEGQCDVDGWTDVVAITANGDITAGLRRDGTVLIAGETDDAFAPYDVSGWKDIAAVSAGDTALAGLKTNGTVVTTGGDTLIKAAAGWTDVTAISVGWNYMLGLRADGTVAAAYDASRMEDGRADVGQWSDVIALAAGDYNSVGLRKDGTVLAAGSNKYGITSADGASWKGSGPQEKAAPVVSISAGRAHSAALHSDGTVSAAGDNSYGQCNVRDWTDIIQVAAGGNHTVGLKKDGTVVATGENADGSCNLSRWSDIVSVMCGERYTLGLRADGTLIANGDNFHMNGDDGPCDLEGWKDLADISAGDSFVVGLKKNGSVVSNGTGAFTQKTLSKWTDLVQIAAGSSRAVLGLRSDGRVEKIDSSGDIDVSGWRNIVSVAAGTFHGVGLRSDGTVVAAGDDSKGQCDTDMWTDIVEIAAGYDFTVGLKADGTVVSTNGSKTGPCSPDMLMGALVPNLGPERDKTDGAALRELLARTDLTQIILPDPGSEDGLEAAALKKDGTVIAIGGDAASATAGWKNIVAISARYTHVLGLKADGTVVAAGSNEYGECDVSAWRNVSRIMAGPGCSCAVTESGEFLFAGYGEYSPLIWGDEAEAWDRAESYESYMPSEPVYWLRPGSWSELAELASGADSFTALRKGGEVLHFGFDDPLSEDERTWDGTEDEYEKHAGQCYELLQAPGITGIVQGDRNIVELQATGKVRVLGDDRFGQRDTAAWKNIGQIACGSGHVAGLRGDGTVVAAGRNDCGQCEVSKWKDVAFLTAGSFYTLGITSSGKVLVAGEIPAL